MGERIRPGTQIRDFDPDDTPTLKYLYGNRNDTLQDLIEAAQAKWPGITLEQVKIGSEYVQTHCLGYDQYDPSDYTTFITLEPTQEYLDAHPELTATSEGNAT